MSQLRGPLHPRGECSRREAVPQFPPVPKARRHGYQRIVDPLSLFQLKDEPEGEGIRQLRRLLLGFCKLDRDYQPQGGGDVGIAERFPRFEGSVGKQFYRFPMLSSNRHFLRPLARALELVKEFALGLLHAPCGFGVTAGSGDVLERVHGETGSEVLSRLR